MKNFHPRHFREKYKKTLLIFIIWGSFLWAYNTALSATDTSKVDILEVGNNMYTTARKWTTTSFSGYNTEALSGFSTKLNGLIKRNISTIYDRCKCDSIVDSGFDSKLVDFLKETPPSTTTGESSYFAYVLPYINEKAKPLTTGEIADLNDLIKDMVEEISSQTKEQMSGYQDLAGMGLYFDGNTSNSPYDIMDDIRRIDEIFFKEVPNFWSYKNNSSSEVSGLITGKTGSWSWWSGKNYDLDLLGEISDAVGGDSDDDGEDFEDEEIAGDCDEWYCIEIEFVKNTHYFLWGSNNNKWKNSFQGIFERASDWMMKKAYKRSLACKVSPTIFSWESEFDLNIKLKDVFNWAGIHVVWKTPPFLKGFLNRKSPTDKKADAEKAKRETEDNIRAAFRRYGMDAEKPTNIKWSAKQYLTYIATRQSSQNAPAYESVYAVDQAMVSLEQILLSQESGSQKPYINAKNIESMEHIGKVFDELGTRSNSYYEMVKELYTILNYVNKKDDCQPS